MNRKMGVRWSMGILAIVAACNGRTNLGNDGNEKGDAGSGNENVAGESQVNTGGSGGTQAGVGGGNAIAGKASTEGGTGDNSDAGGFGGKDDGEPDAYPLHPTRPVPAEACADESLVRNADGQCVPRCSDDGVCAMWRIEHAWTSALTSGEDLYFTLKGSLDPLGNPLPGDDGKEALWKGHYPDAQPTRIASLSGQDNLVLARTHNKTYVERYPNVLSVVGDDGTVTERALPAEADLTRVTETGVYFVRSDSTVARIPLDEDGGVTGDAEQLLPAQAGLVRALLVSDRLWLQIDFELCAYNLSELTAAPKCRGLMRQSEVIGIRQGTVTIFQDDIVDSVVQWDIDQDGSRTLYEVDSADANSVATVADDFLYGWSTDYDVPAKSMLFRAPAVGAAELPTRLISKEVAQAYLSAGGTPLIAPQVTSEGVYWQQGRDEKLSRYIFRLPRK